MDYYRNVLLGIVLVILLVILISVLFGLVSHIDYKRQITGKRPLREYKGDVDYNGKESYNVDLEVEKASKDKLSRNEISHRL